MVVESLLVIGGVLFVLAATALLVSVYAMRRQPARSTRYATRIAPIPTIPATPPPPPRSVPEPELDPNATLAVNVNNHTVGALHGASPNVAGRVIPIDQYGVYIGRDEHLAQVVIDSKQVSKRHVWVGVKDGVAVAIDQNSTNGTYLNNKNSSVSEVRLNSGDTLILANNAAAFTYRS